MTIYTDVEKAWKTMLHDIAEAKESIWFEQYLVKHLDEGQIGRELVELLIKKSKEGLDVRVLVDGVGSYSLILSDYWNALAEAGVSQKVFGLVPRWRFKLQPPAFNRNHRKLLIIDDKIIHLGGVVFTESVRGWQDFNIALEGNAEAFKKSFELMWLSEKKLVKNQIFPADGFGVANIIPLRDQYHKKLLTKFRQAKKRIVVVSPYFSPDLRVRNLLYRAAKKGVEVSVILPIKTDNVFADMGSSSFIGTLLRKGVRVYFNRARINHAKIVIVDDWVTFGSMNFDRLSFFYNYELNLEAEYDSKAQTLINEALKFREQAEETNDREWHDVGMAEKLRRKIGFFLRPFV